jgi:hypothetical protein
MIQYALYFILIAQVAGQSAKLILVNGSHGLSANTSGELLEIDLASKSIRKINSAMPAEWQFVMDAVVCGDKWHGIAEQIPQCAVATVDMKTGRFEGLTHVDYIPYKLSCGKKTGELLVVSADVPMHFGLRKLNMADGSSQVIGNFPNATDSWEGFPSIFSFYSGNAWAAFSKAANGTAGDGTLYKMDVSTGKVELHASVPASGGVPYYIAPSESGKTFGIFDTTNAVDAKRPLDSPTLQFCDVDITSTAIMETNCHQDSTWFANGVAPLQCGSDPLYYFVPLGNSSTAYTPILGGSQTGKFVDAFHLAYQYSEMSSFYAGSLACAGKQMVLV